MIRILVKNTRPTAPAPGSLVYGPAHPTSARLQGLNMSNGFAAML